MCKNTLYPPTLTFQTKYQIIMLECPGVFHVVEKVYRRKPAAPVQMHLASLSRSSLQALAASGSARRVIRRMIVVTVTMAGRRRRSLGTLSPGLNAVLL